MPPKQMNTRTIKEALRYKLELGHSLERTAMALKISKGVVAKYVALSKAAGLDWELIQAMTGAQLQARLLPGRLVDGASAHSRCRFTFNLSLLNFQLALTPSMCHQVRQALSRLAVSKKSTVLPSLSTARYRYFQAPLTLI